MWHHIIFLTVFPCIFCVAIKPLEPLEAPLWRERLANAIISQDELSSENSEFYNHRYPYEEMDNLESDFPVYPRPSAGKRALAMFARWGSINSIGKNRPPIRSQNPYETDDTYNTNNRRMQGQPLRWG